MAQLFIESPCIYYIFWVFIIYPGYLLNPESIYYMSQIFTNYPGYLINPQYLLNTLVIY